MPQPIVQLGEPALRASSKTLSIDEIKSAKIQSLISIMKEAMRNAPGVGLAAPQIGVNLQLAVIEDCIEYTSNMPPDILKERERTPVNFHVIINPILTITDPAENLFFEGCLSIAGICRITPRAKSVYVECLDENAEKKIIEATGWYARILQHEIDHLNGKLYIDHANEKTEIIFDETNRKKWSQASRKEIIEYYFEKIK